MTASSPSPVTGWGGDPSRPETWNQVVREPEPVATFDPGAVKPVLIGVTASVLGAEVIGLALGFVGIGPPALIVAIFYAVLFGGMLTTCVNASRSHGRGRLSVDFGWRLQPSDFGLGIVVYWLAGFAFFVAYMPWLKTDVDSFGDSLTGDRDGWLALVAILAIVVAAPFIEELVFRGVLQRSLVPMLGVRNAIIVQASLFGLYHASPMFGWYNIGVVIPRIAFGIVLGIAAHRWRRLGPGIAAHVINNLIFISLVLASTGTTV
jgi:membrane protease YdiL (CAAX protease family)